MTCPVNGPRAISEFAYGGEIRAMPDPATCSDDAWADYIFNRNGSPGVKRRSQTKVMPSSVKTAIRQRPTHCT